MSNIKDFFAKKSVLITGATGFVGKVLVEKLLRSCDSVESIFILIRTKKNGEFLKEYRLFMVTQILRKVTGLTVNPQERLTKFIGSAAFDRLRRENTESFYKLKLISGDVTCDNLGMSQADREKLVEKVHVIFHCAAMVRFDLKLSEIMKINVIGTLQVLQLAERIKNLKSFVFVSTAFSQSYQTSLEEKHYSTGFNIFELLNINDKEFDLVEKK